MYPIILNNSEVDDLDLTILKMVDQGSTVREIGSIINRSPAAVQERLVALEQKDLITAPPQKQMHRSRKLTNRGTLLMNVNGLK